jgi:AcrR family transcriptional regulator
MLWHHTDLSDSVNPMSEAASSSRPEVRPARRRLLDTATRLFYEGGIHAVGIDRIIAEAGVAKATFYSHFPSKEALVVAYIEDQDRINRAAVAALPRRPPRAMIAAILGRIGDAALAGGFRGCPFLNTAAEFPDPASPVRQAVAVRRKWYQDTLQQLLAASGDPAPAVTAPLLVAISDGLLEIAYLDDPAQIPALIEAALSRLLPSR